MNKWGNWYFWSLGDYCVNIILADWQASGGPFVWKSLKKIVINNFHLRFWKKILMHLPLFVN